MTDREDDVQTSLNDHAPCNRCDIGTKVYDPDAITWRCSRCGHVGKPDFED